METNDADRIDDAPPPLEAGQEIAPGYTVVGLLRRGADIDVYDLWSEERGCRCVGKTLRPDRVEARARAALRREGRLLLRLSHPHIVRAYGLLDGERPLLVLETLPGETLSHLLRRRGRLNRAETVHLGLHLCSALAYLHRHGAVHRDLKPSNVISSCGLARLLDLSIARAPGRVRGGVGTPGYMAPEQARGGEIGPWTDVWGIGALLYEAASGQPAADDATATGDAAVRWIQPAPLSSLRRLGGLGRTIGACLAEDPAARPSVAELQQGLMEALPAS